MKNPRLLPTIRSAAAGCAVLLALAACEGAVPAHLDPAEPEPGQSNRGYDEPPGSVFGGDGLDVFGIFGDEKRKRGGGGGGIGVNNYLWRATLDTLSFMPLSSADPFGGVIITDWYSPPETPDERFKMNVFILGRELRADGVRVSVFRQNRGGPNAWSDAPVAAKTATNLENEILTRARQLRFAARADTN